MLLEKKNPNINILGTTRESYIFYFVNSNTLNIIIPISIIIILIISILAHRTYKKQYNNIVI